MEKKQTSLEKMFNVLKLIEHEDLNNSQYSVLSVVEGEFVNTSHYFGSEERITLQDNCMYVFIWIDDFININEDYLQEPDIKLHVDSQDLNYKAEIYVYKFPNDRKED